TSRRQMATARGASSKASRLIASSASIRGEFASIRGKNAFLRNLHGRKRELRGEGRDQGGLGGVKARGTAAFYHRGHGQPGVAAGVDAAEGFEVHRDVEGQAVEAAAIADPDAECGDLRPAFDVHAGRAVAALRGNVPAGQGVDDRLLDAADVLAHADANSPQVE